jgi:hypothetical protein
MLELSKHSIWRGSTDKAQIFLHLCHNSDSYAVQGQQFEFVLIGLIDNIWHFALINLKFVFCRPSCGTVTFDVYRPNLIANGNHNFF